MIDQFVFDFEKSQKKKKDGMEAASAANKSLLEQARDIAFEIGQRQERVTADDVFREMFKRGICTDKDIGNWAGSIFAKTSIWQFTGLRKSSVRISNHGRDIKIWTLK